ncbi:serine hydrolase [Aquimarina sp. 2201CG5-10]|uniref:serine hydrolase n=1 Tax=Aquimarina callyspongiae TaxID=3098150 RepID=UPI002AB45D7E|nr:serine hydrolase [Aquimarina sp. 2201CG5-10]MDY8135093.1 serine hydrolase [Aquimarina sp. 2201CG5-10]
MGIFNIVKKVSFLSFLLFFFGCKTEPNLKQNTPEYVSKIDTLITKSFERDLFNGNILISKNDIIVYQKSFGYIDGSQQTKLDTKSIFNIGSIAKEFNGVSIMILAERGLLSLDDSISKYDLGLPKWAEKVTIRHLLNYSGGLPAIDLEVKNDRDAIKNLKSLDSLLFEPGTNFNYNNNSVFIQRRLIEKVTSQSFEEFVIENIIVPLKMTNSVFDPQKRHINRTSCYDFDKIKCPEIQFISGWLWTDINDLYKWINSMNSNVLISQESFKALLKNPYVDGKTSSVGEYFEEEQIQRHNGTSYKFESIFLNDFKNDIVIILLSNNRNVVWDIGHQVHDIMLGKEFVIPKKSISQAIRSSCFENVDKGIKLYYDLKEKHLNEYSFENPNELNRLGYELLRNGNVQNAIRVFQLAISEFPNNANVYDSLGEAFYTNEQYELALINYRKSLKLNPESESAKKMIEKISVTLKNN